MKIKIKTLTPIWTGDVNRKCSKIKETGIIGSLRWWYEALVRGLGGYACDPTSDNRKYKKCELDQKKFQRAIKEGRSIQEALDEQICPACQLFGCTGWSRRFRLEISGISQNDIEKGSGYTAGLKSNKTISLSFVFDSIFLSSLNSEHKWLFKKTLWIIENYGAIGGRTTWKPNGKWGTDYGLIKIEDYGEFENWDSLSDISKVEDWLENNKRKLRKENNPNWFNFKFYWVLEGKFLNRRQMNEIVKRNPNTGRYTKNANEFDKWLGGDKGITKKIFSFKTQKKVFGYVRNSEEIKKIRKRLEQKLGSSLNFKTGEEILGELK